MTRSSRLHPVAAALAVAFFGMTPCLAESGIKDGAVFFSEQARAQASQVISDIQKDLKKDVIVETFKEIPADLRQGAGPPSKESLNRVFDALATRQARANKVNGLYILLVREPAHLRVVVGNETQKNAFTLQDRDALVRTMLSRLREKQYDEALLEGVHFISSTMRAHAGSLGSNGVAQVSGKRDAASEGGAPGIMTIIIGVVAVWLLFRFIGSLFGRGKNGSAGAGETASAGPGGGGGFMRSALGGLFGAAAGMMIYDQFFGGGGSSAHGAEPGSPDVNPDTGFSGHDTDYSSSGDSFGNDSGGDGWGGGDSGGDFGGGDSGGGDF